MDLPEADRVLDLRGLTCPEPVLLTKKAVDEMAAGQVIEVWGTDPGTKSDLPAWAKRVGHEFLGCREEADYMRFFVRKGG